MGKSPNPSPGSAVLPKGKLTEKEIADMRAKVQRMMDAKRRLQDLEVAIRVVSSDIESLDVLRGVTSSVTAMQTALQNYLDYLIRERDSLKLADQATK